MENKWEWVANHQNHVTLKLSLKGVTFNVHFHNKSHKRKTICKIIFPTYLDSIASFVTSNDCVIIAIVIPMASFSKTALVA